MSKYHGIFTTILSTCFCHSLAKSAITILFLVLVIGAGTAKAQGLQPGTPTQELIYFGGRLIAVEERGPGGSPNVVTTTPTTSTTTGTTQTAPPGITPPPQPTMPSSPPRDPNGSTTPPANTPTNTHGSPA